MSQWALLAWCAQLCLKQLTSLSFNGQSQKLSSLLVFTPEIFQWEKKQRVEGAMQEKKKTKNKQPEGAMLEKKKQKNKQPKILKISINRKWMNMFKWSQRNRSLWIDWCNSNTSHPWRTCDMMHINESSPISVMQRPTQPTAVVFNSARQPVTQVHVALAQTFVTCDEQGDSF